MSTVIALVVGGGASGEVGADRGGGGGGEATYDATHAVSQGDYPVVVGAATSGEANGNDSTFDTLTGDGGYYTPGGRVGGTSGSGKVGGNPPDGITGGAGGGDATAGSGSTVGAGTTYWGTVYGQGGCSAAGTTHTPAANSGEGGCGGSSGGWTNGAAGKVIIRYLTADFGACSGGTITTDGLYTVHTFTSNGTFTVVDPYSFRHGFTNFQNPGIV